MTKIRLGLVLKLILPLFLTFYGGAVIAGYPEKPVTLVIPYKAGGSTETMARVFSVALAKELGQKVIVRTKPGAGGAIGSTEVAKANPDGTYIIVTDLFLAYHGRVDGSLFKLRPRFCGRL